MHAKLNHSDRYESIAKGQLVSPALSQHVVMPIQARAPHCLITKFRLNLQQIFADLHVCLHEVAPVMEVTFSAGMQHIWLLPLYNPTTATTTLPSFTLTSSWTTCGAPSCCGGLLSPLLCTVTQVFHVSRIVPVLSLTLNCVLRTNIFSRQFLTTFVSLLADVVVSSLSVWDSFISDAHAAYPKVTSICMVVCL